MKEKTIKEIELNLKKDIKNCSNEEIVQIEKDLKEALKKYDGDSFIKNLLDSIKKLFATKRKKCEIILLDLVEEIQKPNCDNKEEIKDVLLKISNIHKTLLENIITLLRYL